jgi:hypothetical protein
MAEMETLTPRERILRTFRREPVDRIVWQPRFYYWYNGRKEDDTMPERYRGMSMLEVYDDLGASPRYPAETLGINLYRVEADESIRVRAEAKGNDTALFHETPVGMLREVTRKGSTGTGGYHVEYAVKTPGDMRVMQYILEHTRFLFDRKAFDAAEATFGDRCVTQTYYPRAPLQRLIINYMGFESTVFALNDWPDETQAFMKAIEGWDDGMYEEILSSPLEVVNFGENIDSNVDSPDLFAEYLIPYYAKRVKQLHEKGKFCHIHIDGSMKPLLPLINEAGFDGIEAATPLPQGDVTLEELKDALGDTVLLDGIPAVLFLPHYSEAEFEGFVKRVLEMFSPNLILGISDELPPPGEIERVRRVTEMVAEFEP